MSSETAAELGHLLPTASVMPFVLTLLGIAVIPLRWPHLWESNRNKALFSAVLGVPPFSIMATAAGVLAIRIRAFCAIVVAGRALRFALVIAVTAAYR